MPNGVLPHDQAENNNNNNKQTHNKNKTYRL